MVRRLSIKWNFAVVIAMLFLTGNLLAQPSPVKWHVKANSPDGKKSDKGEFGVEITGQIAKGWYIYSITQPEGGPTPTRITAPDGQGVKLSGKVDSPKPIVKFDEAFSMNTETYEGTIVFTVPLVKTQGRNELNDSRTVNIDVYFQACNGQICLLPRTVKLETAVPDSATTKDKETGVTSASEWVPSENQERAKTEAVDFLFTDFEGKSRKFSEFRGRYVLLDFWATWCRPCLADFPKLALLHEKYKSSGFEIIGMGSETIGDEAEAPDPEFVKETDQRARQVLSSRRIAWPQATSESAVPVAIKLFDVQVLPTKILIDREGRVVARIGERDDISAIIEEHIGSK